MQTTVDGLILLGVVAVSLLLVRHVTWIQNIWGGDGRRHPVYFMMTIASMLIVKDILSRLFNQSITACLADQGIDFVTLYGIYALLWLLFGVMFFRDEYKNRRQSSIWVSASIHIIILAGIVLMPFWS